MGSAVSAAHFQGQRFRIRERLPQDRDVVEVILVQRVAAVALKLKVSGKALHFLLQDNSVPRQSDGGADPGSAVSHRIEPVAGGVEFENVDVHLADAVFHNEVVGPPSGNLGETFHGERCPER